MPWIHVQSGLDAGRSFEVADGATVGRDPSCTIPMRDVSISRRHARIALEEGAWRVHDTQSRNGLAVRGERVTSAVLDDGAEFQLGEVRFRFGVDARSAAGDGDARTTTPTAAPAPASDAPDEIVLEGDWTAPPAQAPRTFTSELERTAARPMPRPVEPARPIEPREAPARSAEPDAAPARASSATSGAPSRAPATPSAPLRAPATPSAPSRAPAARGVQMRAPERGQGGAAATRAVLQYNKVEAQDGLAHADLAQLPAWAKLAIAVVALALFAGLFWAAFHTASFFKGKTSADAVDVDDASEPGEPR